MVFLSLNFTNLKYDKQNIIILTADTEYGSAELWLIFLRICGHRNPLCPTPSRRRPLAISDHLAQFLIIQEVTDIFTKEIIEI